MGRECDMIANLTKLPECVSVEGVKIKQVYPADKTRVMEFVRENFHEAWAFEAEYAIMQPPGKCFIAVEDKKIIGFSCYDTSAKGFFGPVGVTKAQRKKNIGKALTLRTLHAMREYGYGYAIIGWVGGAADFYRKICGAEYIEGGEPENSVYTKMIDIE